MIITLLWEDQRGGQMKGFGPHELLVSCVVDDLGRERGEVERRVLSAPKKGSGNVLKALRADLALLRKSGPVCAIVDRDRIRNLWPLEARPLDCFSAIRKSFFERAPGDYALVLLVENAETLVEACCNATERRLPESKPSPEERDRILARVAWGERRARDEVRRATPSFDRIVRWVRVQIGG